PAAFAGFVCRASDKSGKRRRLSKVFRERLRLAEAVRKLEVDRAREADRVIPALVRQELTRVEGRLATLDASLAKQPDGPMVYSVVSIPPRPIWVLKRGDVEQPREQVVPGGLGCVPALPGEFQVARPDEEGQRRLALAG